MGKHFGSGRMTEAERGRGLALPAFDDEWSWIAGNGV